MSNRLAFIGVIAAGLVVLLASCSDTNLRRYTYRINLTTDQTPHTVELWRETNKPERYEYAFSLRFPHAYYTYENNHFHKKQTTIGLAVDKKEMRPWTAIVSEETGLIKPLAYRVHNGNPFTLAALPAGNYDPRLLMVTVEGGFLPISRTTVEVTMLDGERQMEWRGFHVIIDEHPMAPDKPALSGYTTAGPLVFVHCQDRIENCTFQRRFGPSTISFNLPRENADDASQLSDRLIRLIRKHVVPREISS